MTNEFFSAEEQQKNPRQLVRPAAVAGMFYPGDSGQCAQQVLQLLRDNQATNTAQPKALIVPHAGYIYSGPVAAKGYNLLKPFADKIHRVALFGPSHRVPLRGMALSSATQFATPLGKVRIDHSDYQQLLSLPDVAINDEAHALEHSLEVHLPFLQTVLPDFQLIPIVVGYCSADTVAECMKQFWQQEDCLIVVSSDLSHYLDYQTAQRIDRQTSEAILRGEHQLQGEQACGCYALNGLLLTAGENSATIECVELANSGDTAGSKDQVVGYGSYVIH